MHAAAEAMLGRDHPETLAARYEVASVCAQRLGALDRAELGLDGAKAVDEATRAKLDALKARPSSTQKIF